MLSKEQKEMLHENMKAPLLEISKARRYAFNVLSCIEACEVELLKIDLIIDMDDNEAAKAIEEYIKDIDKNADSNVDENFVRFVGMMSYVRIPEKFKEYREKLKEYYGIGVKTLMEY